MGEIPNSPAALNEALERLVRAVLRGDADGVETERETIGLAYRRLLREIAELNDILDHQPKESVLH